MVSVALTAAPHSQHTLKSRMFVSHSVCSLPSDLLYSGICVVFEMDQDIASTRHFSIITLHNKITYE